MRANYLKQLPATTAFLAGVLAPVTNVFSQNNAKTQSTEALLAGLRDLHVPEPPPLWPLAPGWWGLGILTLLLLVYIGYRWFANRPVAQRLTVNNLQWRDSALTEHQRLSDLVHTTTPANQVISQVSVLLRRVALARLPREAAASVQSDQWLLLLDKLTGSDQYSQGIGRVLLAHPYQKTSELDRDQLTELLALVKQTIMQRNQEVSDV